jgi:site-specific recombinase XerD
MRVRFYIEKRKGKDGKLLKTRRPIFMTVAFHGKRVMISTGKFVDLKWWDQEQQQVNEAHPEARLINVWLDSLAYTAGIIWRSLASLSEKPGAADFRREFERLRPRFSEGFFEVMFLFMKDGSARWSSNSYRKVRTFYGQLQVFARETGYPMRFDRMNEAFIERFRTYQSEKGFSDVTVLKMVNTLVWFLNWATKQGYNVYHDYRRFYKLMGRTSRPEAPLPLYLEWEELMKFWNYRTVVPRKERICDLFCLMCFTGIRFSELAQLRKGDADTHNILIRGRGRKDRLVPLNKYAQQILRKYRDRYYRDQLALPPVSVVTMNKYLAMIAKEVGLYRNVGERREGAESVPLYEKITAGVAVQTFIMNALRLEIPAEVIGGITGVRSDQRVALLKQEIAKEAIKKFNDI